MSAADGCCSFVVLALGRAGLIWLLVGLGVLVWVYTQRRRLAEALDRERVRVDLRLRGAELIDLTPLAAAAPGDRRYEVRFHVGDHVERRVTCALPGAHAIVWDGELPALLALPGAKPAPEPAEETLGQAMPSTAPVAEPTPATPEVLPGASTAAPQVEDVWDQVEDAREYEGAPPEEPVKPVADLLRVLRGGEPRACEQAVADLVRHGSAALPELEQALSDQDADVRVDVKKAIALIRGT